MDRHDRSVYNDQRPIMFPLTLQAAATIEVAGLLNVYVLVCDREGSLVPGLSGEAFDCVVWAASGQPGLRHEGFVEAHLGCYCLALHHEPRIRMDMLTISVRQRVRTNPVGLAPVFGTVAEGHVLVPLTRAIES